MLAGHDVVHVLGLELERFEPLVDAFERLGCGFGAQRAVARTHKFHELCPRESVGVLFAQLRKHVCDVLLKHGVGRYKIYLVGAQALAVAEQQERDALQQHRGLAAACHAAHQHCRHVFMADDSVLFLLDRCRDGLELRGTLRGERGQQQRVLNGHRGVEVALQHVALDVELTAQLQVGLDLAAVCPVRGLSHVLVVVGLGHRRAPIHHNAAVQLVGHASRAQVDVARRGLSGNLQPDVGKVGLLEKQAQAVDGLNVGIVCQVERLNHAVCGSDVGIRFHREVVALKVGGNLLAHVRLVFPDLGQVCLKALGGRALELLQLTVDLAEMRLLFGENLIFHLL